ncbi:hypothetical protein [Streptomyces sp. NPDC047141]|uniref:hypothetical protein n=1 Tax=Streptomyces sp. NPDC047141 TaxID=3155738 RepID=UPI0033D496B0
MALSQRSATAAWTSPREVEGVQTDTALVVQDERGDAGELVPQEGELTVRRDEALPQDAVPITGPLAALTEPRAGDRHDTRAVRHLAGAKTRPAQKRGIARLPEPLRGRRYADPDGQRRTERQLAPPQT